MTKILSIDWDYFFGNSFAYDWAHKESMFFLEAIWSLRLTNHNLITGEEAFSTYKPKVPKDFWGRILKGEPIVFLAESHASITSLPFKKAMITSLDAHHDCGYGQVRELDCGNWLAFLKDRVKKYHLVYPSWRKVDAEGQPNRKPDTISWELPAPAEYDFIFVCRSGCWTPPWYDHVFRKWIKESGLSVTPIDSLVIRDRSPNMREAKTDREQFKAVLLGWR